MTEIDKEAVAKMEAELRAAEEARIAEERTRAAKLIEDATKKGKEEAMREFEAEQEKKRLAEENAKLQARLKSLEEATAKNAEEMAKKLEAELQALKAERKGIARNDSPFNQTTPTPQLGPEEIKAIDERSRKAFEDAYGIRFSGR